MNSETYEHIRNYAEPFRNTSIFLWSYNYWKTAHGTKNMSSVIKKCFNPASAVAGYIWNNIVNDKQYVFTCVLINLNLMCKPLTVHFFWCVDFVMLYAGNLTRSYVKYSPKLVSIELLSCNKLGQEWTLSWARTPQYHHYETWLKYSLYAVIKNNALLFLKWPLKFWGWIYFLCAFVVLVFDLFLIECGHWKLHANKIF